MPEVIFSQLFVTNKTENLSKILVYETFILLTQITNQTKLGY